jgi:hypothetical protein
MHGPWVLTNYLTESLYIYYCCSRVPRTLPLPNTTTLTLPEKWRWANSAPKRDKHANYSNKLLYEGATVTVAVTRRGRGVGRRNDEATVTNDSSSIAMRPTGAKRCRTDGKSNETQSRRAADGRHQNVLGGTTSRDFYGSTTTYNTQGMGENTQLTNRPTEGWGGTKAFLLTKEGNQSAGLYGVGTQTSLAYPKLGFRPPKPTKTTPLNS